ncbi:hypothetical protein EWB00_010019 [Schistosoma japonicum]|uniref:Transmembrane protein n=1 Tax=Schistosoma japonicum TaxID=6182 RepID=A0A4Z2CL14_SCHJA|nr:hypothetical protein EWB00_010019 [Schistosoma japonicum]
MPNCLHRFLTDCQHVNACLSHRFATVTFSDGILTRKPSSRISINRNNLSLAYVGMVMLIALTNYVHWSTDLWFGMRETLCRQSASNKSSLN